MQVIGKGMFTTAYRYGPKKVLLKTVDPVKEAMANGYFPNTNLFPKLTYLGKDYGLYVTTYYPKCRSLKKSLKPSHYAFYRELCDLYYENCWTPNKPDMLRPLFKKIKCSRKRKHMIDAVEACMLYGPDVCFEISPRNVAVSSTGGLILLDVFFMKSTLLNVMSGKLRYHH